MKGIQATREASSPPKENIKHLKHDISSLFLKIMCHICPPGSGSGSVVKNTGGILPVICN